MAIQVINVGTVADDGTGETLRSALTKANDNFADLDERLSGEILTVEDVGGAAYLNVGTIAGTVAAGDDPRFLTPTLVEITTDTTITDTAPNSTLLLGGTLLVTLPDNLADDLQVPLVVRPGNVITFTTSGIATVTPEGITLDTTGTTEVTSALLIHVAGGEWILLAGQPVTQAIMIACSDQTTALTTGAAKVTVRAPFAFYVTGVRASVVTAPTGSVLTVDINEGGASILSTKLTIDAAEKTSTTAASAAVISDPTLADDAEITVDIDTVGSTVAGAGLVVSLIGFRL